MRSFFPRILIVVGSAFTEVTAITVIVSSTIVQLFGTYALSVNVGSNALAVRFVLRLSSRSLTFMMMYWATSSVEAASLTPPC